MGGERTQPYIFTYKSDTDSLCVAYIYRKDVSGSLFPMYVYALPYPYFTMFRIPRLGLACVLHF